MGGCGGRWVGIFSKMLKKEGAIIKAADEKLQYCYKMDGGGYCNVRMHSCLSLCLCFMYPAY